MSTSQPSPIYTIENISSETGVTVRNIYNWIKAGVVPRAVARSVDGISYTEDHMRRVRMVKAWLESRITLEEMAERIEILGEEKALAVIDPYESFTDWDDFDGE